jgi:hypothetical protein
VFLYQGKILIIIKKHAINTAQMMEQMHTDTYAHLETAH